MTDIQANFNITCGGHMHFISGVVRNTGWHYKMNHTLPYVTYSYRTCKKVSIRLKLVFYFVSYVYYKPISKSH